MPTRFTSIIAQRPDEQLSLKDASHYLLEECRMVLPGVQALFGFQLIAVFNQRFSQELTSAEQCWHLFALALVALSAAFVMAPASYHREAEKDRVSENFLRLSSRLLLAGMWPLALGICIDFYLIARIVLHDETMSMALAILLLIAFVFLWFAFPWLRRRRSKPVS